MALSYPLGLRELLLAFSIIHPSQNFMHSVNYIMQWCELKEAKSGSSRRGPPNYTVAYGNPPKSLDHESMCQHKN